MMIFEDVYYEGLAMEVLEQVEGCDGVVMGAVEMGFGNVWDVVLGFDCLDGCVERCLVIVFEWGVRCSCDFEIERLRERMDVLRMV